MDIPFAGGSLVRQASQSMPKNPEISQGCLNVNVGGACGGACSTEKLPVGYIGYMIAAKK